MNARTIATFPELEPAEKLKNRLENAGIHAVVHDEANLQRFAFMAEPAASKKVEVDAREVEKARQLLDEWHEKEHILDAAIRCPECNSTRVEYPQYTRKFFIPWIVEVLASLGMAEKSYYCLDCQYTWPKTPKKEVKRDPMGWPVDREPPGSSNRPE
jgi:hypothetical protein